MRPLLHVLEACNVPPQMAEGMYRLSSVVWPSKYGEPPTAEDLERHREKLRTDDALCAIITDEDAGSLVAAKAKLFRREILLPTGRLKIGALAGVCTLPDYQGHGLGRQAVQAVLALIDNGQLPVALWQTGVPGFYEKLGARLVRNRFHNSTNAEDPQGNPWWEPNIMIYPAAYPWPDDDVDLLGPGF